MSQYKISKKRLAEIIKEEYESVLSETSATTNEKLTLDQVEIDEESGLEELKGGQKELDKDNDGDIDAEDMAALRAKKKVKKESLDSIRHLIQQELKNL